MSHESWLLQVLGFHVAHLCRGMGPFMGAGNQHHEWAHLGQEGWALLDGPDAARQRLHRLALQRREEWSPQDKEAIPDHV